MPKYMDSNEQMFWITVMGSAVALIGLVIKAMSRSKCDNIEFCCLKVHRDVEAESKLDEIEIANTRGPSVPAP